MKTFLQKSSQRGSALLVTLASAAILGAALASYLKLVQYQNTAVVRSQIWNSSIPLCEAGIEEALTHLNMIGDGNRESNGWKNQGGQFYMNRSLGSGRYQVWINSSNQPSVTAIGYATEPVSQKEIKRTVLVNTTKFGSGMRGIVAKQEITMSGDCRIDSFDSQDPNHSTNGRYDPAKAKANGYAGSVYADVNTGGAGVWGSVGTGPHGTVSANAGDAAWMASHTGVQPGHYNNDLNLDFPDVQIPFSGGGMTPLNNQTITVTNYAYLESQTTSTIYPSPEPASGVATNLQSMTTGTKPFSWTGTLTTNLASTTSTSYPAAETYVGNVVTRTVMTGSGKKAVSTTYYDYSTISGYTYETSAYTYNTVTTNTTTTTRSYAYVTDSGNYQVSSFSMGGQNELLVRGDTVLYITGDLSMSGQSQITILPGASLKIFLAGNASLSGNGLMNLNQDSSKFSIFGLPTSTSFSLGGNASFTGTIYAPNAAISFSGGGASVYDCVGAIVVRSASFSGNFEFHYDERLGRSGGKPQYKIASWSEI